jgi:hypothetical protein
MESPVNAATPRAAGASAAASRVPAADPLTREPSTAETPSLSDILWDLNSATTAREPATETGPLNSPQVSSAEDSGDAELNEAPPLSPDDGPAEVTADPLFED